MSEANRIASFMKKVLDDYNSIRGKQVSKTALFWDVVVISAVDELQQKAFEFQLTEKQERYEVPLGVEYLVFNDPPGNKIGSGGSAMHVSEELTKMYGSELYTKHILFIPAGGYSQRLPSWSVLGKLFCPLPIAGDVAYQMLDLIFAVYRPFLRNMPPGVLLVSSDAIISYYLDDIDCWIFNEGDFSALAHLTPVSVAKNHGVYVLKSKHDGPEATFMSVCLEILQKPSEELMKTKRAVVQTVISGTDKRIDMVYSDSIFFFNMKALQKLCYIYGRIKPLSVEIDAYRDFLIPLGLLADISSISAHNLVLHSIKKQLFDLFHGSPLSVCVLKQSSFHHFGTMAEYAENLTQGSLFTRHFPFQNIIMSCITAGEECSSRGTINGTVMHSFLHHLSQVDDGSVVEYCDFDVPLHVNKRSIVSNCKLREQCLSGRGISLPILIPPNILLHTIPVDNGFLTICFGMNDQIKKCGPPSEMKKFSFLNTQFGVLMNKIEDFNWFDLNCDMVSLWEAKLFTVCQSMEESFIDAYQLIDTVLNDGCSSFFSVTKGRRFSMKEVLSKKRADVILNHFKSLITKIQCP